ncbi:MAG: hypothetical protein HKL86_10890 [Acidimicrobiaceae bacterium]|nr:hypothetical protein [Acidimicrobiaceae bacterium]
MTRRAPLRRTWRIVALSVVVLVALVGVGTGYMVSSATTTSTTSSISTTSTTTIPPERHQLGWTIVSSSKRGVMVDYRNIKVGTVTFRAVRLRARTTLLRWHVGSGDPNQWVKAPPDAAPAIDWSNEGRAGVVAVFNGGFKQSASAGGSVVDGLTMVALVKGDMTIVINRAGHWEMGVWGAPNFPTRGFNPITYRQNLTPLVLNSRPSAAALSSNWNIWGSPLNNTPYNPRTGLGVDAQGNLIYVATMQGVLARTLAQALVAAGAIKAMELDMNPYWPILGAAAQPLHHPGGTYNVVLAGAEHSPNIYDYGWSRDFFVALAEPASWTCNWASRGLKSGVVGVQPQPIALAGPGCSSKAPTRPTTTTTPIATTTSSHPTTTSPPASSTTVP